MEKNRSISCSISIAWFLGSTDLNLRKIIWVSHQIMSKFAMIPSRRISVISTDLMLEKIVIGAASVNLDIYF